MGQGAPPPIPLGSGSSSIRQIGPQPRLMPVRNFIRGDEPMPRGLGAYGMVVFTHLPTPDTRARLLNVCRAFLSSLPPQSSVPASVPPTDLMVTYWPLERLDINLSDCNLLIDTYHLYSGYSAMLDAQAQGARVQDRRGPFLIGWSPAESRFRRDAVVLVIDLSPFESEISFLEMFQRWRTEIVEKPELWRRGFAVETIRLSLRDLLDRYGQGILQAVKGP